MATPSPAMPWFSTDYQLLDGGQSVTLHQLRGGEDNPIAIDNAVFGPLTGGQYAALGGINVSQGVRSWTLNNKQVVAGSVNTNDGIEPGDTIDDGTNTDGTNIWVVINADLQSIGTMWKCVCRRQVATQQ